MGRSSMDRDFNVVNYLHPVNQLRAVNLGDDADTAGAIYGQLAGTYYGVHTIPQDWIKHLALGELISELATALFDFSNA
jgi:ADP-ribosyl-[dinitrogen reductase] hydrolase